jgi:hypothetical protein
MENQTVTRDEPDRAISADAASPGLAVTDSAHSADDLAHAAEQRQDTGHSASLPFPVAPRECGSLQPTPAAPPAGRPSGRGDGGSRPAGRSRRAASRGRSGRRSARPGSRSDT